ncbi:hypothetical protein E1B28_011172 [Marasmius oreades]|uniref:Uncharacterized protein n=1 Tax=Marasmius oreades TaxID=181124 RepID=A0A9P7UP99_9AGAR|nr:uncharacterized protein E1B28_011172 [Marasmius oreades]KAG7089492.1 hypothetical protein E1B28_011172 [Marasmius oreades]
MALPYSEHPPRFVVRRKRKRQTYIDPCLGFDVGLLPNDPNAADETLMLAPNHDDIPKETAELKSNPPELPTIETLEDSVGDSEDTVESPKQPTEISVDSFLRSRNKSIPKPYPTFKLKVKQLTTTSDDFQPPPPPKHTTRRRQLRICSPPSEPVDQLFSDSENDSVIRKKPRVIFNRQKKVSFAQRLLQAAVVSEVDPIDVLLPEADGVELRNSLSFITEKYPNQVETQAPYRSKRRRWSLIDPRKRDSGQRRFCSFSSRTNGGETKPLTRWLTEISTTSNGDEDCRSVSKKTEVETAKVLQRVGKKRKKNSTVDLRQPQTQTPLSFVPLQEAESRLMDRKKRKDQLISKDGVSSGKRNTLDLTMVPTLSKPTPSSPLSDAATHSDSSHTRHIIQSLLQPACPQSPTAATDSAPPVSPAHDHENEHTQQNSIPAHAPAALLTPVVLSIAPPFLPPVAATILGINRSSTGLDSNRSMQIQGSLSAIPLPPSTLSSPSPETQMPLPRFLPHRPLSSYFDEFFKTAKDVNHNQDTEPVRTRRRGRQQPTVTTSSRSGLTTKSTEPMFDNSELVPRIEPEPEPDMDVLETIISRSSSQYEVILSGSPLPLPERRPNTAVRRSMAGLRAFYDV